MRTRAETIFQNGVLWTGIDGPRDATALAVAGGRIAAVGSRDEVLALRGPDTRVVDLAGQTLVPGFVDAHAHIWKIGHLLTTLLDVRGATSLADVAARLRAHAGRFPPGPGCRDAATTRPVSPTAARPRAPTSTPP